MTAAGAIRLAQRLEPFDPLLAQAHAAQMPEEMARVARQTNPDRDRRAARRRSTSSRACSNSAPRSVLQMALG